MMQTLDKNKNKTKINPQWLYIADHPYRMFIIGSGSEKINAL